MPKKSIDYSKTVIYKIVCNDLLVKDVYVGNTTDFRNRKNTHKCSCNTKNCNDSKKYNRKIYQTIRENGGWDNWTMIQIEEYCCNNSNEATARERYWYETLNANMNKYVPNRSKNEYDKNKLNQQFHCECGGKYLYSTKLRHIKTKKHQNYINSLVNQDNII